MPQITLIGRLVRDPELRFTPQGAAVTSLSIVTSDRYKDNDGKWQENNTVFWDCTAWRDLAERIAEAGLQRGDAVIGVGKTSTEEWEDKKTGAKRSKIKVTLDSFGPDARWMLVSAKRAQRSGGQSQEQEDGFGRPSAPAAPAEDPWATPAPAQAAFAGATDEPPF